MLTTLAFVSGKYPSFSQAGFWPYRIYFDLKNFTISLRLAVGWDQEVPCYDSLLLAMPWIF